MDQYHYTECGLDNIWLANGFEIKDTPYGEGVVLQNIDSLHQTIGLSIAENSGSMSGKELKFLRREMDLTQARLASLINADEQSVGRWERGEHEISGPASRMVSMLYLDFVHNIDGIRERIEEIAALDKPTADRRILSFDENKWDYDLAA